MLRRGMQAVPDGQPNCHVARQGDTADLAECRWNQGFLISRQLSRNDNSHWLT